MKGTDLTPDQLAHAEAFLREVAAPIPVSGAKTTVSVDHLVRVLAWYGAIRAKSGSVVPQPLVSLSPMDLCITNSAEQPIVDEMFSQAGSTGYPDYSATDFPENDDVPFSAAEIEVLQRPRCVSCGQPAHAWTPDGRGWCPRHSGGHEPPAETLQAAVERKTAEIEAAGLCHWDYQKPSAACSTGRVINEVLAQCAANDEEWGGPKHDDTHKQLDWIDYIRKQCTKAVIAIPAVDHEKRLINIAGLAVQAIQSSRRKRA
jgi:hypothetical protein